MHAASVSAPTSLPPSRSPHGAARGGRGCSGSFCSAGGPPPSLLLPPARSLRRCPRLGRCLSRRWFRLDLPARTLRGGVPPVREVVAASARAARNARSAGGGRIVEVVARRHLLRRPSASLDFLGFPPEGFPHCPIFGSFGGFATSGLALDSCSMESWPCSYSCGPCDGCRDCLHSGCGGCS